MLEIDEHNQEAAQTSDETAARRSAWREYGTTEGIFREEIAINWTRVVIESRIR